jgi:hypothetical protein
MKHHSGISCRGNAVLRPISAVVPGKRVKRARPGTHNHRRIVVARWGDAVLSNQGLWLWVPVSGKPVMMAVGGKPLGPWRLTP